MEVARHWRLKAQRYRLEGSICPTCGQVSFPPRPVCAQCAAQAGQVVDCEPSVIPITKHRVDTVSTEVQPY